MTDFAPLVVLFVVVLTLTLGRKRRTCWAASARCDGCGKTVPLAEALPGNASLTCGECSAPDTMRSIEWKHVEGPLPPVRAFPRSQLPTKKDVH